MTATFLEMEDLPGTTRVRVDVPTLRLGDPLKLRFRLERIHLGRREQLEVSGGFRVTSISHEIDPYGYRQIAKIAAVGVPPSWKAVKLSPTDRRQLPPAKSPPTLVE
jgi:hypothetical protein